jgi:transposase
LKLSGGVHTSKNGTRRNFDRAFKVKAVRLVSEERRKVAEVAQELDIQANLLHRWKRELSEDGNGAFVGKGHQTPEQEELRRLRRELADVKEERDILKKAISVFSRRRE